MTIGSRHGHDGVRIQRATAREVRAEPALAALPETPGVDRIFTESHFGKFSLLKGLASLGLAELVVSTLALLLYAVGRAVVLS